VSKFALRKGVVQILGESSNPNQRILRGVFKPGAFVDEYKIVIVGKVQRRLAALLEGFERRSWPLPFCGAWASVDI